MPDHVSNPAGHAALDDAEVARFLAREARCMDEGRYDEWLSLWTEDGLYWVPCNHDDTDPMREVSLIYDDRRLLETRIRRLASPRMYSQEPRSRTSRTVANVTIEDAEGRLKDAEEGSGAYKQAERDKQRAEAFLNVAGTAD